MCAATNVTRVRFLISPIVASLDLVQTLLIRWRATMRRHWQRAIWVVAGLLIFVALFYRFRGATMLGGFNWQKLGASLASANILLLLLSLGTIFVSYAIRALRWAHFSRYMGRPTFPHVYSATLMGFAAIFLLGRAGEPIRPLLIARKDRLPVTSSFGVYVLERIFDAGATAVMAILVLLALPPRAILQQEADGGALLHDARLAGWVLLAGFLVMIGALTYFRLHGARGLQARLAPLRSHPGWRGKIATMVDGFSEGLQAIRSPADVLAAVGYTTIHWLVVALVYWWIILSFRAHLGYFEFRAALLVLAFTMVGSVVQLPAVGGGMQLATFLALTIILGVEKEPAAAIAILTWLITFAAVSLVGVPLLIREGWSMGSLRQLAREESEDEARGKHATLADIAKDLGETRR